MIKETRKSSGRESLDDVILTLGTVAEADLEKITAAQEGLQALVDLRDGVRSGKVKIEDVSLEDVASVLAAISAGGVIFQAVLESLALAKQVFTLMRERHAQGKTGLDASYQAQLDSIYATACADREGAVKRFIEAAGGLVAPVPTVRTSIDTNIDTSIETGDPDVP
jgi:hypothetical protein